MYIRKEHFRQFRERSSGAMTAMVLKRMDRDLTVCKVRSVGDLDLSQGFLLYRKNRGGDFSRLRDGQDAGSHRRPGGRVEGISHPGTAGFFADRDPFEDLSHPCGKSDRDLCGLYLQYGLYPGPEGEL